MSMANKITLARAALLPPILLLLFLRQREAALALFLVSCAGDVLDGIVARSRGEVTAWGKALDPAVDKTLFVAVLSALTALGEFPLFALVLFLVPQLCLAAGALVLRLRARTVQGSRLLGKAAAVLVVAGLVFMLLRLAIGRYFLYSGIAASYLAGVDYLCAAVRATRSGSRDTTGTPPEPGLQTGPSSRSKDE
jgi:phosphatidylglycerophosphate synthase